MPTFMCEYDSHHCMHQREGKKIRLASCFYCDSKYDINKCYCSRTWTLIRTKDKS